MIPPRLGPSRGEEWALQEILMRSRSLVTLSGALERLAEQALPEELLPELLPELEATARLLEELHGELRAEITTYRATRDELAHTETGTT